MFFPHHHHLLLTTPPSPPTRPCRDQAYVPPTASAGGEPTDGSDIIDYLLHEPSSQQQGPKGDGRGEGNTAAGDSGQEEEKMRYVPSFACVTQQQ